MNPFLPVSKEDLETATLLVQNAIGYDRSRGDNVSVVCIQFDRNEQFEKEDEAYKKRGRKGLTILENVKEFLPETITRDELKNMVYNCIGDSIVPKSEYVKGKNLTKDQVEGIIDIVFKTVTDEDDNEEKDYDDPRLNDVKVKIGFYDADKENIRKFFFRGKNPTDEEVETMLKNICGGNENTKLLALDLEDK